jgi:hypothetical protein
MDLPLPMDMGEYHVTRLIGRGGMGVVLEGEHRRMQRRVAIKVLSVAQAQVTNAQEQFLSEIRAVARLLHPRIVTAFDAGQFDSIIYLVMEYVEGATLFQLVRSGGPYSVRQALRLIRQAAEGLAHAHLNLVIHRDVKPGNMMVGRDGHLKLLDLGLAAFAPGVRDEENPSSQLVSGTPEYMPPEQFEGGKLSEAVDIYALGSTLVFLLSGEPPYTGRTVSALMRAHSLAPIPRLEQLKLPPNAELQALLDRLMAKRPKDRFASMEQVIAAIDRVQVEGAAAIGEPSTGADRAHESAVMEPTIGITTVTLGVDLGERYLAAATLGPQGSTQPLEFGTAGDPLLCATVAWRDQGEAVFGAEAEALSRESGTGIVDPIQSLRNGGRIRWGTSDYPATLPVSLLLQHAGDTLRSSLRIDGLATDLVLTMPAAFGQLTRERMIQAAESCSFATVRLIDRNLAAALSQFNFESREQRPTLGHPPGYWLVISISDLSLEVALLAVSSRRVQMLSVAVDSQSGHPRWRRRIRRWIQHKLARRNPADSAASRDSLSRADLNRCIDGAIDELVHADQSIVRVRLGTQNVKATITAKTLLANCMDLVQQVGELLAVVLSESGVDGEDIVCCLTIGSLAQMQPIRNILRNCGIGQQPLSVSQSQLAAAATVLTQIARMPQRLRPRLIPCVAHDLGLQVGDPDASIQLIIPRLTSLPASVGQQLRLAASQSHQLTLVESVSTVDTRWIPFAKLEIETHSEGACESRFEIDDDGLVQCHFSAPKSHRAALDASSSERLAQQVDEILRRNRTS